MDPMQTIDDLNSFFENLKNCNNWSLQLLKINTSKRGENMVSYYARRIFLTPDGKLTNIVHGISKHYAENTYLTDRYEKIEDYDGVNIGNIVYRLPLDSQLVNNEYASFSDEINNPDSEGEIKGVKFSGYVIYGRIDKDGEPIKLISLQNPISSYDCRNRFKCDNSVFREINGDVLQMKEYIDAVIYGGYMYMMSLNAEKLFDMQRAYKNKCEEEIQNIVDLGIVSNAEAFIAAAGSGHNPRKFVSFNQHNLELLAGSRETRAKIGEKFRIPLTADGTFDTTDRKSSDNIVKILCNKAMLEPFGHEPMEVESARTWK